MNRLKKYASLLLALVMALALAVPAMAGENEPGEGETLPDKVTVTVDPGMNGHSFSAFQIFKAEGQLEDAGALGNVAWGDGIKKVEFVAALKKDTTVGGAFSDIDDANPNAQEVAEAIGKYATDIDAAKIIANLADANKQDNGIALNEGENELAIGYYLIVDTTDELTGQDTFYNASLLQLTTSIHIRVKGEAPKVEKEVEDVNDSETGDPVWGTSADHDIGDHVKFKLTATLPSNFTDYEQYNLVFHDTLSEGLTFDEGTVTVKLVNGEGDAATTSTIEESAYTVTHENGKLTITFDDVTTIEGATNGSKIVVEYTATLNEQAQFINKNEVYLEYSNNPNYDGEGDKGTTPPTTVIVLTYKGIVNKVDGENKPLPGAGFTLYKYNAASEAEDKWELKTKIEASDAKDFTFSGLDDGWYKLVESETPAGYNTAADIYFKITAVHERTEDGTTGEITGFTVTVTDENGTTKTFEEGKEPFTVVADTGEVSTSVVNNKGATLPETGGIGTTIFYALGGLLTVGAVVLLVTKKRMSADEK